jgi:hypothetical protein
MTKVLSLCLSFLALAACAPRGPDLQQIATEGRIALAAEGKEIVLPVEAMDIFLTEDDRYPETFHLHGPQVDLVGQFPPDLRVGYGEEMEKMVGREVKIAMRANPGGEGELESHLTLAGSDAKVSSGTFQVDKVLGQNPQGAGKIVQGRISLLLRSGTSYSGTFLVLAKTWG